MKCTIKIDKAREEEIIIYAHDKTELVSEIEELVASKSVELFGYKENTTLKITASDVFCFTVESNKIYAHLAKDKLLIKKRLYEVEETLGKSFVKINQSCIVNISKIESFNASFAGALMVTLKNGYKDYISRRQIKTVKERIGF